MKTIHTSQVTDLVERLCMDANYKLAPDIENAMKRYKTQEKSPLGREILGTILENARIARTEEVPMCQDTGMTVVYLTIGQEVHIEGGSLKDAVNEGVRRGYRNGYLRKSVVKDPFDRTNTGDNTPAVIHYNIVEGEELHILVAPKGFGSENKSQLIMLTPSQGVQGVKDFVIKVVRDAGPNPCPPIVVGVGVGGTMERCAYLSKLALMRPVGSHSDNEFVASLEKELLEEINRLGIGPAGFGGTTTALAVNILTEATHIAGLPVAVNIGCHATRHAEGYL